MSPSLWQPRTPARPSCCLCCCWLWPAPGWWAATLWAKPSSISSTAGWRWRTTVATTCPGLCTDCCPSWEELPTTKPTIVSTMATTPPTSPTGTSSLAHTMHQWSLHNVTKGSKQGIDCWCFSKAIKTQWRMFSADFFFFFSWWAFHAHDGHVYNKTNHYYFSHMASKHYETCDFKMPFFNKNGICIIPMTRSHTKNAPFFWIISFCAPPYPKINLSAGDY